MFFNKDKNKVEKILTSAEEKIKVTAEKCLNHSNSIDELYPEKWIEVKGYKAVSKDLTSFHNDNFIYKINEPNYCEGKIELCKNGLHFCPRLEDINEYAPILKSRIFEVTAVVDENYIERRNAYLKKIKEEDIYSYYRPGFSHYETGSKLVAKSMTFVRELSEEEIYEKFKDIFIKSPSYFNMINSIEDFKTLRFKTREEFKSLSVKKYYKALVKAGYSQAYAKILTNSLFIEGTYNTNDRIDIELFNLAIAYAEEGLSPDMRAYLLASKLK